MNLTPEQVALAIAGVLVVPVLQEIFKQYKPAPTLVGWIELGVSFVVSLVALLATGGVSLPSSLNDPVAFVTAVGQAFAVVFALAQIVFAVFQKQLQGFASSFVKATFAFVTAMRAPRQPK